MPEKDYPPAPGQIVSFWTKDPSRQHGDVKDGPYVAMVTMVRSGETRIDCTVMPPAAAPYPAAAVPAFNPDEDQSAWYV